MFRVENVGGEQFDVTCHSKNWVSLLICTFLYCRPIYRLPYVRSGIGVLAYIVPGIAFLGPFGIDLCPGIQH